MRSSINYILDSALGLNASFAAYKLYDLGQVNVSSSHYPVSLAVKW